MTDCVRVTACRLCEGPLDLIYGFTPTPPGDQYLKEHRAQTCYPLDLMTCRSCGAVQLADTVDPSLIYTDYLYTTSISPGLTEHFEQYAASVLELVKPAAGLALVVDIGSNDGTLLKAFKTRGFRVLGVEPASAIAARATDDGVNTVGAYYTVQSARVAREAYGPADIITANHVMANVADLHDFIDGIKTLLAPDGTFVFETGYWPAIQQGMLIDTIEHEHIHYFAVEPLLKLFARHGLRLFHVEQVPTKGGSLRGYVGHAPKAQDATVSQLRQLEESLPSLASWATDVALHRFEIVSRVGRKPAHERWVGYGAAVGSTLQLYHFGLGDVMSELWDDNASRHGMVSPGFHLPVVAPNSSQADKIVLLAWRYADRIIAAHPEHAGKWIIPLPTLRTA